MKKIAVLFLTALAVWTCSSNAKMAKDDARMRKLNDWQATSYHRTIEMKVGWIPYQEIIMTRTGTSQWQVSTPDSNAAKGKLPVMILSYPDTTVEIILDLHIDNALLGNLIKHTLMTEIPVERPYMEYLKNSDCGKCHPPDIKLR